MISRRERWSYAAGDLGFNFVWQSTELYLLYYYIRGLGLAPEIASAIFLIGAGVDWIVDPLVGTLADRFAVRIPFRIWVVTGGPIAVLLLVLAFAPLPRGAPWVPMVALATYLALRAAYGVGNIPYGAMTARLSSAPRDHLALTSARMQGAAVGGLVAASVFALLPVTTAGADFRGGALLLAGLALPAFLICYFGTHERVVAPRLAGRAAWIAPWRVAWAMALLLCRSAPLRRLIATILTAGLAVTVVNKSLLFLFEELGALRLGFVIALVPAAALLLTTPLWAALGARIGRRHTLVLAAALNAVAAIGALAIGGVAAILALTSVAIVAGCGMSVMFWSLVPAAVADCEGRADEIGYAGRVYALANIARKLAQGLAPSVVAFSLVGTSFSTLYGIAAAALLALLVAILYGPADASDPIISTREHIA
ncbi:MFS transporter [Sphingomonas psychrolutea]|uniref:MFS transporter n=1 Tax=Sphingomonas psychrolutea TaxID=1259676 RepID=A0ABQ1GGM4_9SPHN|nr:MFS transporter [Sphingomonas psychrolutea]GGA43312.1 MFS transporter [Sphingomonas psychrolutea]